MAKRRMISLDIYNTDKFLEMAMTAQNLYTHLLIRADDDGFVANPKRIKRMIGASEDDGQALINKGFIIPFATGVVVITHWDKQNKIQPSKKIETDFQEEKKLLEKSKTGGYILLK